MTPDLSGEDADESVVRVAAGTYVADKTDSSLEFRMREQGTEEDSYFVFRWSPIETMSHNPRSGMERECTGHGREGGEGLGYSTLDPKTEVVKPIIAVCSESNAIVRADNKHGSFW
jgi:hypothetical protein